MGSGSAKPAKIATSSKPATTEAGEPDRAPPAPPAPAAGENVEKIREILFGSNMRDYDRRFTRIEERLVKEAADLKDETRKRIDAMENYLKGEIKSLSERLSSERSERNDSAERLSKELSDLAKVLERRAQQLEDENARLQRELRQQLFEQGRSLGEEISKKIADVISLLENRSRELRYEKVDRAVLAGLLTEIALGLSEGPRTPGFEDLTNGGPVG